MNKRRITGILAALILAIVGTVALVGYVKSAKDKALADEALVDVYVVDERVPKGADPETIKSAVAIEQVPARLMQEGAITDLEEIGSNIAGADLLPGDQLLAERLVPEEQATDEVTDRVQISALLEAERAVGGTLQKGDLVGVYLSFEPFELYDYGDTPLPGEAVDPAAAASSDDEAPSDDEPPTTDGQKKSPNLTRLEFQHVLVTNVQTTSAPVSPEEEDEPGVEQVTGLQYVVTIALSPEQSERFVFAAEFGHVWLSKDPLTVSDDGTRPVTLGNVYSVVK